MSFLGEKTSRQSGYNTENQSNTTWSDIYWLTFFSLFLKLSYSYVKKNESFGWEKFISKQNGVKENQNLIIMIICE